MNETPHRIGFAFFGSFCTFSSAMSTSLVADFSLVPDAVSAALEGRQIQPVVLGPRE